jgi:predicted acyltransferase
MFAHAIVRAVILVLLSVMLASNGKDRTNWSFTIVLAQIGLGYPFLFLLAWLKPRWQLAAALAILLAYWGAFAIYPRPAADLDLASVDLPASWQRLTGFASHWDKNTNLAARFDQWFLNLFPRADGKPFKFESGGYQTLNFIPSLATMVFGLLAGELVRGRWTAARKIGVLLGAGAAAIGLGWALDQLGICPIIKRIWTPSWTIFSAGFSFATLAVFYLIVDVWRLRRWAYPLVVVGANSIAVYCMSMMLKPWFRETLRRHVGKEVFELPGRAWASLRYNVFSHASHPTDTVQVYGKLFAPMAEATIFLLFCWAVCWWMYRKKIFIKI